VCKIYQYGSSDHDENGMPKALCISEPFLGIYKGEGQRAAALYKQILQNTDGKFWKHFSMGM
jgi:hypothetical protein